MAALERQHSDTAGRRSGSGRRADCVASAIVNLLILWAMNVWPGWDVVPFLTSEMGSLVGLINASLVLGILASVAALAVDRPWFGSLRDLVTTAFSVIVEIRVWQVFPFDVTDGWAVVIRVLLALAIGGTVVATGIHVRALARACADSKREVAAP